MAQYVVIGTHPTVDTSVVVGPFRSAARARDAWDEMTAKGYNAESCELFALSELEPLVGWDDGD